jgi:hypothetical protein
LCVDVFWNVERPVVVIIPKRYSGFFRGTHTEGNQAFFGLLAQSGLREKPSPKSEDVRMPEGKGKSDFISFTGFICLTCLTSETNQTS